MEIRRSLASSRPDAFLPDPARSLSVLHDRLVEVDRPTAALAAIWEALDHLEPFFRGHPAAFASLISVIVQRTEQTAEACGEPVDHARLEAIREILQQLESRELPE
ncbi:MAG: hypothetical protein AAGD01_20750 [Acidobacteriota bacterium]